MRVVIFFNLVFKIKERLAFVFGVGKVSSKIANWNPSAV